MADRAQSGRLEDQETDSTPGIRLYTLAGALIELLGLLPAIAGLARRGHEEGEMRGLKTGIDFVGALDAAEEEGGGQQQEEGKCHLRDDQGVGERDAPAAAAGSTRAFLEDIRNSGARRAEGGDGAEQETGGEGNEERKEQDGLIEFRGREICRARQGAEEEAQTGITNARPSEPPRQPSSTLSVSNWRTRRERLAPMARRTAISWRAGGGTREQQVRDIRAGDQQHDADDERAGLRHRRRSARSRCRRCRSRTSRMGRTAAVRPSSAADIRARDRRRWRRDSPGPGRGWCRA